MGHVRSPTSQSLKDTRGHHRIVPFSEINVEITHDIIDFSVSDIEGDYNCPSIGMTCNWILHCLYTLSLSETTTDVLGVHPDLTTLATKKNTYIFYSVLDLGLSFLDMIATLI